ncbi:MAG: ornithine cyclodeaminase [Pseudomonadota bacterium]
MPEIPYITAADMEGKLTWPIVINALRDGHMKPRAVVRDAIINRGDDAFLSRLGWVDQTGFGVKAFSVFSGNAQKALPTVQGVMVLFDDLTGKPVAMIDGDLVTKWKTAADSALGASLLARPDSENLLVVGAGEVARNTIDAYRATFPSLNRIEIWNRTPGKAEALADALRTKEGPEILGVTDLASSVQRADLISTGTLSTSPLIFGADVPDGAHVDLIGAYKADMREADDTLMRRAEIFVDSRDTTLDHIGELLIPLTSGVIKRADVRGDLYDVCSTKAGRSEAKAVTVFKNGGGAHLDVMTARAIFDLYGETV